MNTKEHIAIISISAISSFIFYGLEKLIDKKFNSNKQEKKAQMKNNIPKNEYTFNDYLLREIVKAAYRNSKPHDQLESENKIFPKGEIIIAKDYFDQGLLSIKIGDGETPYSSLPYQLIP